MPQAVHHRVGQRRSPQGVMPRLHGQLPGAHRRPALVALFHDLAYLPLVFLTARRPAPIIPPPDGARGQGREPRPRAALPLRPRPGWEAPGEAAGARGPTVATRWMAPRTAQAGLPPPG